MLFEGLTLVSLNLDGAARTVWQVCISATAPMVFGWILSSQVSGIDVSVAIEKYLNWSTALLLVYFASCGWGISRQLDRAHPVRGFVIAAAIFFCLIWLWQNGFSAYSDESDESSHFYVDASATKSAHDSGFRVIQYLLYTLATYIGLLAGYLRNKRFMPR
jgi:hypothetical protein